MTRVARKVALVAVSAVLVACSVETGKIDVTVWCEADGCGKEGILRTTLEDCDEGTASYGEKEARVMLSSASTLAFHFGNVLAGDRCVQSYLDVDTSGSLSAGDVVSAQAIHEGVGEDGDNEDDDTDDAPEIGVEVEDGETSTVDIDLDTVVTPEL